MAAIVCHGLHSSYLADSRIEYRLVLPSPKSLTSCWSSMEGLWSVEKESYVHPELKQSSLRLSAKSLELCTENLGNETGSDIIESDIEFVSCGSWEGRRKEEKKKKARQGRSFPPPLTTIRGTESIRVKPHREDGRLVLELTKVKVPSCFQAERSHGRLRLCFSTNIQDHLQHQQQDQPVQPVDAHNDDQHPLPKGTNAWSSNYERPSRCNEADPEHKDFLLNWGEPFCVAIS